MLKRKYRTPQSSHNRIKIIVPFISHLTRFTHLILAFPEASLNLWYFIPSVIITTESC